MLVFYGSRIAPQCPPQGPGLIVTIGPDDKSFQLDMEIEDLSGATRDHSGPNANVSLLHMMCDHSSSVDQQNRIRDEIKKDPGSFYRGVYAENLKHYCPLKLFYDDGSNPDIWKAVTQSLMLDEQTFNAAIALTGNTTLTPCYGVIISTDGTGSRALLAGKINYVPHP